MLYKAVRRGEKMRVFEILLCAAALAVIVLRAVAPAVLESLGVPGKVLVFVILGLFLLYMFGVIRWAAARIEKRA